MSQITETEAVIERVRREVAKRKGLLELPLEPVIPAPAPKKKPWLKKAVATLERARAKHLKAQKWPRLFRSLRRNQEVIDEGLIASAQAVLRELERMERQAASLEVQQANLVMRLQKEAEQNRALGERFDTLEKAFSIVQRKLDAKPEDTARLDPFYLAFEDQFRGSRELIRERMADYLPFLHQLLARIPHATAVDLGCGRGEWLQFLKENGIAGRGVDLNGRMVAECRSHGMQAMQGDAMEYLTSLPDASVAVVSGFHIVEHLSIVQLLALLAETRRVLQPGGMAIFETPNPECLKVSTYTFYLDPTHRNPVPMELLSFIATHSGFSATHVERLHPYCEEGVLKGYGDYAGIFTK